MHEECHNSQNAVCVMLESARLLIVILVDVILLIVVCRSNDFIFVRFNSAKRHSAKCIFVKYSSSERHSAVSFC
jgi:hypothetical protein